MFLTRVTSILMREMLMTVHIWGLEDIPIDHLLKPQG